MRGTIAIAILWCGCQGEHVNNVASDAATDSASDAAVDSAPDALSAPGTWKKIASSASAGIRKRASAQLLWTGSQMLMWGGDDTGAPVNDGGIYDPATDTWKSIPNAPFTGDRGGFQPAVYSGTELIVLWPPNGTWVGAAYDLATRKWRSLPAVPSAFGYTADFWYNAVWSTTTNEVLAWGGNSETGPEVNVGVAYNPATNKWRALAPSPLSPRWGAAAVWDGQRMVIFEGYEGKDLAAYDPKSDKWTEAIAAPIGWRQVDFGLNGAAPGSVVFFGGGDPFGELLADGVFFDGMKFNDTIPDCDSLATPHRQGKTAWFGAGRLFMWGGTSTDKKSVFADGATYDPKTSKWSVMPASPLSARSGVSSVWTGSSAILWGGWDWPASGLKAIYDDGAIFTP